jgi:proteasome lid subunit RPN8/RPN11
MTLRVTSGQLQAMREHARRTYPEECIGILGGTVGGDKLVVEVRPLANARVDSRHNRSLIAPADFVAVDREYRARRLVMVGFYHSHPDHPAAPSEYDRENALPWHSYVIVRVERGDPAEVTAWLLRDDRSAFDAEEIAIDERNRWAGDASGDREERQGGGGQCRPR